MKMTPEQKAFYEYGRAVESLRNTIKKIRCQATYEFGELYYRLTQREKRFLKTEWDLKGEIRTVRRKRATCRELMGRIPLEYRDCLNCQYCEEPGDSEICDSCKVINRYSNTCNWKPKE